MARFASKTTAELSRQLLYFPFPLRRKAMVRAEKLTDEISPGKVYPYEFVAYRVTLIRPTEHLGEVFAGKTLRSDLIELISQVSASLRLRPSDLEEPFLSLPQVVARLAVSRRTVFRWRRDGLRSRNVFFGGKRPQAIFMETAVRHFEHVSAVLIAKARAFARLTESEREEMVRKARSLRDTQGLGISKVARILRNEFGCSAEAIRYALRRHDEKHPASAVFARLEEVPLTSSGRDLTREQVLALHERGLSAREIARASKRHRATVYRILNQKMAEELLSRPDSIGVYNPVFDHRDAEWLILKGGIQALSPLERFKVEGLRIGKALEARGEKTPQPLDSSILSREEEIDLFRRFNFHRYQLSRLKVKLSRRPMKASLLRRALALEGKVEAIKETLVAANLRLVTSVASRHLSAWARPSFQELLSDGNYSLLKAVDKFDYSRGVRFSTYAYWAILKNFAKSIPGEHSHRKLFITGQEEIIEATSQKVEEPREDEELLSNLKERLGRILNALNPRERSVILHRFGLVEGENPKTLAEIGKIFGLTRERIRQIEIKALGKLRAHLDLEVSRVALS